MYKIIFFAPTSAVESVCEGVFSAGAGRIGDYEKCCFKLDGIGQFKPLQGASPHIGEVDKLEFVKETRVEMVCEKDKLKDSIKALRKFHPYEEPAFDVIKLEDRKVYE